MFIVQVCLIVCVPVICCLVRFTVVIVQSATQSDNYRFLELVKNCSIPIHKISRDSSSSTVY